MIAMPMGDDDEIELGQVDTVFGIDVMCEDLRIVACVEQDALAAILDKAENPESFSWSRFCRTHRKGR